MESSDGKLHGKELGKLGEDLAVRFIERLGYEVIERNWTCSAGEADIIAYDGDVLVFIEVKTRSNIDKGLPEEAVTPEKRARYEKIAMWYVSQINPEDCPMRFDVIGIMITGENSAVLRHCKNAFGKAC